MIHVPFYPIIRAKKRFFGEFYGACRPEKIEQSGGIGYTPVFDSCWKKKSLYPLCLLGYSDFCHCFEL